MNSEKTNNMINLFAYPYQTYVPNKVTAACVAAIVSISLIAWFIQSCQTRFRPIRLSVLLLISHLAICAELIVRATVNDDENNSTTVFSVVNGLFTIGQRVIIIGNFSFVLEIHHEKSRLSRGILLAAMLGVITSGLLMIPANMKSFDADEIDESLLYRQLSASTVLVVTFLFYPVLLWSKTIKDMTMQGITLIIISSVMCFTMAIFFVIQSISKDYYEEVNSQETWFYALQMTPIILAHFTWSIFHPKRSLQSLTTQNNKLNDEAQLVERT